MAGQYVLLDDAAPAPKGQFVLLEDGDPSFTDSLKRQAGLTVRAAARGAAALPGMVANIPAAIYNTGADIYDWARSPDVGELVTGKQKGFRFRDQTQAADALVDTLGLPSPQNAQERISGDVASAMAGQGVLAKLGGWMTNAAGQVVRRVGDVLKTDPGIQITAAGTGTAASSGTREAGGGPLAQVGAGVGAGALTTLGMMALPKGQITPRQQAVIDSAAEHDVPLTYSDVTGRGKRLDTWLEGTPFVGTSKFREQGAAKATTAAERVVEVAKTELDQTGFRGMNQLKLAAQGGDKSAQRVLDQIENAGNDWQKIMQASGNMKLWRARQAADELYTRVEQLSQGRNMPVTKTALAIDDAIAAETSSKLPDTKLLKTLQELKANMTGAPTDFSSARALRSDLGDIIANAYKGENALVGAKGVGKLSGIQGALEQDMEQFAVGQGGALERAWRRADDFYKTAVVPYKDKALARALSSDTPDEIYSAFIRTGRSGAGEDRAVKFYDALDPKGKAAVRYGMLTNAMDDAAIAGKDTISPARFAQSLEKIAPGTGVFFKGDDKQALDGFTNLMRHAERFGQYAENPPTGQRVIPMISMLGAMAWPKVAAAIGGGALVAREATTRPALRDALIRASQAKPGSVEMQRLAEDVSKILPQVAATRTPSASQPQQEQ